MRINRILALLGVTMISLHALGAQGAKPAASDSAQLQGKYVLLGGTDITGVPVSAADTKNSFRITTGNKLAVTLQGSPLLEADVTIDPSSQPKTMDYVVTGVQVPGTKYRGIYQLHGDTVKLCFGGPNAPRPTTFVGKAGQTLFIWLHVRS